MVKKKKKVVVVVKHAKRKKVLFKRAAVDEPAPVVVHAHAPIHVHAVETSMAKSVREMHERASASVAVCPHCGGKL